MAYQHPLFTPFHGDRLRLARLLSSWSLDELGARVSASRQYMHQLETGAKEPSPAMVAAIASTLHVQERFFAEPLLDPVREDDCHFRKVAAASRAVMAQAAARGTIVEALMDALERKLRLPSVRFPDLGRPARLGDVEKTAEEARRFWGLGLDGPVTNMTRVVENAGAVVVHFADLSDRIDALSIVRRRPIIVRSTAKPAAVRLRFDLAHECGHLVMHAGLQTGDHDTEDEANRFASAFLLPRAAFSREFPRGRTLDWTGMLAMKQRWRASLRAILRRAFDLGLIDPDQYRRGQVHLSKTGQTKVERLDDQLATEQPELLDAALRAFAQAREAPTNLADLLGVDPAVIEAVTGRAIPRAAAGRPAPAVVRDVS